MFKNVNRNLQGDLRKRDTINDLMFFNNISIQSCMVILVTISVLLYIVLSITAI